MSTPNTTVLESDDSESLQIIISSCITCIDSKYKVCFFCSFLLPGTFLNR